MLSKNLTMKLWGKQGENINRNNSVKDENIKSNHLNIKLLVKNYQQNGES